MQRSWIVTATVIAVSGAVGLGAGATTALLGRPDDRPTQASGDPSGPASTTPGTGSREPTASTGSADVFADALYYADGVIHDGDVKVDYQPRFRSTVALVSRIHDGWVVSERFGQGGARLVLVTGDGATTPVEIKDPHWYAVSPQGTGLAVPDYQDPHVIDLVDTTDGTVVSTLTTTTQHGSRVVDAVFTGVRDELLILTNDIEAGRSELGIWRADDADGYETLRSPPGGATSRLVGADAQGTRVLVEYLLRDKPCVTVLDLTADAAPLWKSCRYRPLGSAGVSPDAESVALAPATADVGAVTDLTVADADTGRKTGFVRISSGFRLIDATWADPGRLVVQGVNDASTAETIDICSISHGCESAPDAGPDNPADDVAPGS